MAISEQTVADTQTGAEPPVDGGSVQTVDPLDELLASYDEGTKDVINPPSPKGDSIPNNQDDIARRLNQLEQQSLAWSREKDTAAFNEIVNEIKGDLDIEIAEGWVIRQAQKDKRLDQAFIDRNSNPKKWAAVKSEMGKRLHKAASRIPDPDATGDRNAVAAAVKGASKQAPAEPAPDYASMSPAEFQAAKKRMFRK